MHERGGCLDSVTLCMPGNSIILCKAGALYYGVYTKRPEFIRIQTVSFQVVYNLALWLSQYLNRSLSDYFQSISVSSQVSRIL